MIKGILTQERIYNSILQNKTRGSESYPGLFFGCIIF